MSTVFLSGSRKLSKLNKDIKERLAKMMDNGLQVLIGDANGADKAMQAYFADSNYNNVTIYCAGSRCRNNVGEWNAINVDVDPKLKGRAFYTQKDKAMASIADIGFIVWDGKSEGSLANAIELLGSNKKVVMYVSPEKRFYNFTTSSELLETIDGASSLAARGKIGSERPIATTLPLF